MHPPPDRHARLHMQHRLLHLRAAGSVRGQRKERQVLKIAKYSDEWNLSPPHRVAELVRKASTHRYLTFDPVIEHIASEI